MAALEKLASECREAARCSDWQERPRMRSFARAFCGKEVCFKALGTGNTAEIGWRDIEILQAGASATAQLGTQRLQEITPPNHASVVHVACAEEHS